MEDKATRGDEQHACPRCGQRFRRGERISQSERRHVWPDRRQQKRDIEWAHTWCALSTTK